MLLVATSIITIVALGGFIIILKERNERLKWERDQLIKILRNDIWWYKPRIPEMTWNDWSLSKKVRWYIHYIPTNALYHILRLVNNRGRYRC